MLETMYLSSLVFAWAVAIAHGGWLIWNYWKTKTLPFNAKFYGFLTAVSLLIANYLL